MPQTPGSSFIPKRSPTKKVATSQTKRIYLLGFVSYLLIVIAVIASGLVFIYKLQVQASINEQLAVLNEEIESFNQADLDAVKRYVARYDAAADRVEEHLSLPRLLAALERSTVDLAQIRDFSYERFEEAGTRLQATIVANDFNTTIFQRDLLLEQPEQVELEVSNVSLNIDNPKQEGEVVETNETREGVIFTVDAILNDDAIRFQGVTPNQPSSPTAGFQSQPESVFGGGGEATAIDL